MRVRAKPKRVPRCDQCGELPQVGDELVMCQTCGQMSCTTSCIAGSGVECFECERDRAEHEDARAHQNDLEFDLDDLDDFSDDDFCDESSFPSEDYEDDGR